MINLQKAKYLGRTLGLNRVFHQVFREPVHTLRKSYLEGGPIVQRRTARGKADMMLAATQLKQLERWKGLPTRNVYFLTGKSYWYQTVFCFMTLYRSSAIDYLPVIVDDGSIDEELINRIANVIPWAHFYLQEEILDDLATHVPESRYPLIRRWRIRQPLTRKLTDVHGGKIGWKLLLDSDMLFFRPPDWLSETVLAGDRPVFMVDCWESYGYSSELRARIAGTHEFPDRANIGIFGFRSEELDLDWMEYALRLLEAEEGPRYNITQGLTSMLFAGRDCAAAPEGDYLVLPSLQEGKNPTAVMHQYVAYSKRSYFQYGWQRALRDLDP